MNNPTGDEDDKFGIGEDSDEEDDDDGEVVVQEYNQIKWKKERFGWECELEIMPFKKILSTKHASFQKHTLKKKIDLLNTYSIEIVAIILFQPKWSRKSNLI